MMFCSSCAAPLSPAKGQTSVRCARCGHFTTVESVPGPAPGTENPYAPELASVFDDKPPVALDRVSPAPRTPSPRARKLVFGYQGKQRVVLIVGLAFTGVGLVVAILLSALVGSGASDVALSLFGTSARGSVIESHAMRDVSVNHAHPTAIRFKYTVGAQALEAESSTLDQRVAAAARPGAPIAVEFFGPMPTIARAEGSTSGALGIWGMLFYVLPFVGVVTLVSAVRSNRREIRAFVHGTPVVAFVVSRGLDRSAQVNGRYPTRIVWRFDVAGVSYTGSISHMEPTALGDLMQGGTLVALYDPNNPKINTVFVA